MDPVVEVTVSEAVVGDIPEIRVNVTASYGLAFDKKIYEEWTTDISESAAEVIARKISEAVKVQVWERLKTGVITEVS